MSPRRVPGQRAIIDRRALADAIAALHEAQGPAARGEIVKALRSDDLKQRILLDGGDAAGGTPEEFAVRIKADIVKWGRVVKLSGAKVD